MVKMFSCDNFVLVLRSSFRPRQGTHQRPFSLANSLGIAPKVPFKRDFMRDSQRVCLPQTSVIITFEGSLVGAAVTALASWLDSWTRRHMWVEFVVGSLPCSARFFSGYSGFPLSLKINISKFQFNSRMHGHF